VDREKPIYICSNDHDSAGRLAFDLRHYGYKARTFVNAEVMANAAGSAPPALVLLDLSLTAAEPDRTAPPLNRTVPLIALSDRDDFETRLTAANRGAVAFFTKPVSLMSLIHEVRRLQAQADGEASRTLLVTGAGRQLAGYEADLRAAGYPCEVCSPERLVDTLRDSDRDMVLIDADLADYAAATLVRVIRQIPGRSVTPVLLCTAGDKRALDSRTASETTDGTVGLPVAPDDLAAIVRARANRAAELRDAYRFIARRDPVTGLHNAEYFIESLSHNLAAGRVKGTRAAGVLYVLLDGLDALTSAAERQVVQVRAAETIRRRLPAFATAARVERDAFAAVFTAGTESELERVRRDVDAALASDIAAMAVAGGLTARVGLAVLDGTERSVQQALHTARAAINPAATSASQPETRSAPVESSGRDCWARRISDALESSRFRLVYQPISSLSGHPSSLFEVFVRMLDADNADILPSEFLPAVLEHGLSAKLDRWIISRAIHVLSEQEARRDRPRLFIKVFSQSLADDTLTGWIADQLETARLPADRLVFEITLQAANARLTQASGFLDAVRALGCGTALENYAASEDRQTLLSRLPLDFVKLSPELSGAAHLDRDSLTAVTEITSDARKLGAAAIAAQVQDAAVLSTLWQTGVEYIQGYFMQEPADVFAGGD